MKRALLIGINYFSIPSITLNGCVYDVINISHMLIDAYDYNPANITILRDDINNPSTMPTRANILNNLTAIAQQSGPLDEIWIHYSGHGSQIPDKTGNESTGFDQIIVPMDYQKSGFITDNELLSIVQKISCKALLIFDACHSGTMCDLPWCFQYVNPTSWIKTKNNNVIINNPNIYMISGCKDEQTSSDAFIKTDETVEGAFTNAFMNALRYYRHNVGISNLYQYICQYLASNGFSQIPILSTTTQTPNYTFARATTLSSISTPSTSVTIVNNMKSIMATK